MKKAKTLIHGPIDPAFVSAELEKHQDKYHIGAHAFFLGQVRADQVEGNQVSGIEYSAYEEMVDHAVQGIKDRLFTKYQDLSCVHIYHSLGTVRIGEVSLLVMVSSPHRRQALEALDACVEEIKANLPVWKKEVFEDHSHRWL